MNLKYQVARKVLVGVMVFITLLLLVRSFGSMNVEQEIDYSDFKKRLREGKVAEVSVRPDLIRGKAALRDGKEVNFKTIPMPDPKLIEDLEANKVAKFGGEAEHLWWPMLMQSLIYVGMFYLVVWLFFVRPMP